MAEILAPVVIPFRTNRFLEFSFLYSCLKKFDSSVVSFEIKNMSKKTNLLVDDKELGYLNKMDLQTIPVRFGDYQFLVERKMESVRIFEIQFFCR